MKISVIKTLSLVAAFVFCAPLSAIADIPPAKIPTNNCSLLDMTFSEGFQLTTGGRIVICEAAFHDGNPHKLVWNERKKDERNFPGMCIFEGEFYSEGAIVASGAGSIKCDAEGVWQE